VVRDFKYRLLPRFKAIALTPKGEVCSLQVEECALCEGSLYLAWVVGLRHFPLLAAN
jgi:hypothetical protein